MGRSKREIGRRFPKPQVTGSNPVGVTSEPSHGGSSLRATDKEASAYARRALRLTLLSRGMTRKQVAAVIRTVDDIYDIARRVQNLALSALVREVAAAVTR